MADNKLEHFLNSTGGHCYAQQEHTWSGKECRTALDHVLTWNYYLPPQTTKHKPKSHNKFDLSQIWTQLPHLDFPKLENPIGQALADLIHKEQKILAKEVRWLQDKAWKARRRAEQRREHRNKTQN